jgi:hypothetical protein
MKCYQILGRMNREMRAAEATAPSNKLLFLRVADDTNVVLWRPHSRILQSFQQAALHKPLAGRHVVADREVAGDVPRPSIFE